jgi:hypothetical protein
VKLLLDRGAIPWLLDEGHQTAKVLASAKWGARDPVVALIASSEEESE